MHASLHTRALLALLSLAAVNAATTYGYADQNGGVTGGAGGTVVYASTGTAIHTALCSRSSSSSPIIIYVQGTITLSNTAKVSGDSCNTAADRIEIKQVDNVSIIGYGTGAIFDQIGIHIREASNIIIQNVHIRNVKKSNGATSNGGDAISMETDVSNVWVDHCTLEASGGEDAGYDALCDMKDGTKYVTVSYTIYMNSGRGSLVGSSDTDLDNGPVTYHHNYYYNMDSRMPLLRGATAHSYNNYFYIINESAMNPRIGGKIRAEANYFKSTNNPVGTFYTDDMGYWDLRNNILDSVTWTSEDHPAGASMTSTTTVSIPYTFVLDTASCVPTVVLATAGASTGLRVTSASSSCATSGGSTTTTPTPPATTPRPPTATPTPAAASAAVADGTYILTSKWSGKVVEVAACATANSANVQQYTSNGALCQQWLIKSLGTGYYRILNANSLRALEVTSKSTADGGNVAQYLWNEGTNQQWAITQVGNYYAFVNRNSGKAMDVWDWSTADGGNIAQYTYWAGDTQLYTLTAATYSTPAPKSAISITDGTYVITSKWSGLVLTVDSCGTGNGYTVQQGASTTSCGRWGITGLGGGYFRVLNTNSNRALDVSGASTAEGGDIIQYLWSSANNQQWLIWNVNGYYAILNRNSGMAVTVQSWSKAAGGNVAQSAYTGVDSQLWTLTSSS